MLLFDLSDIAHFIKKNVINWKQINCLGELKDIPK